MGKTRFGNDSRAKSLVRTFCSSDDYVKDLGTSQWGVRMLATNRFKSFGLGLFLATLATFTPNSASAVLFNAPDIYAPGKFGAGLATEVLLENPTSEGAELRVNYGVTKVFTAQGLVGIGSDSRRFRFGGQTTFSIYPDADGQIGVAVVTGGMYMRRPGRGVFVGFMGPMIHETFNAFAPLNTYLALPFAIELEKGRYFTGSHLVFGSVADLNPFFITLELGLGMGVMQSYVSAGGGVKF